MTGFALVLRYWGAGIILALVLLLAGQQARVSRAKADSAVARAETANLKTEYAQAAAQAEAAARAEESRRTEATRKVIEDAQSQAVAAQSAAAGAAAAADGLRKRVAAFIAASRQGAGDRAPAGRGASQQGADALDVLANVFARTDDAAGELAAYGDRLRVAGLACERSYDALTPFTASSITWPK